MSLRALVKRNVKVYFKDKGTFFPSLITPVILLVLFITFLKNVYIDSIKMTLPNNLVLSETILNGFAGSWLISSLLSVSCITVAFCANMIMVQDKVFGTYKDLTITPVKRSTLNLSYYIATVFVTAIVCYTAFAIGILYLVIIGFYMSFLDVVFAVVDIALLVLFGTALSSIVCLFLNSQGAIGAVSSLVSSMYGFICGAYMPLSQFGDGVKTLLMFLPGTYGTGLIRNHMLNGVLNEVSNNGVPDLVVESLKDGFDANLYFFDTKVSVLSMYLVLVSAIVVCVALLTLFGLKSNKKRQNNNKQTKS